MHTHLRSSKPWYTTTNRSVVGSGPMLRNRQSQAHRRHGEGSAQAASTRVGHRWQRARHGLPLGWVGTHHTPL